MIAQVDPPWNSASSTGGIGERTTIRSAQHIEPRHYKDMILTDMHRKSSTRRHHRHAILRVFPYASFKTSLIQYRPNTH